MSKNATTARNIGKAIAKADAVHENAWRANCEKVGALFALADIKAKSGKAYAELTTAFVAGYVSTGAADTAARKRWQLLSGNALVINGGEGTLKSPGGRDLKPDWSPAPAKAVKAKGSGNPPVSTGVAPAAVVEANRAGAQQEAAANDVEGQEGEAPRIPLSAGQSLALLVNQARAGASELGAALGALDSKVKGRAESLAAFNRLADTLAALERMAAKALSK